MDESFEPEAKCLEVAEKIIACLNDGSIIGRFQNIKKNIFSKSNSNPDINSHLKQLSYENIELTKKLNELKNQAYSNQSLEEYTLDILNNHISTTSPKQYPHQTSIDDACSALIDVFEARTKANTLIRQQLTDENSVLRDNISKADAAANEELKEYRQRRLDNDHRFRKNQKDISNQIAQIRSSIEKKCAHYDDIIEENAEIEKEMADKGNIAKELMEKLHEAEVRHDTAQQRMNDLKYGLDKIENQVKSKIREIEAYRASQKFGIDNATENELEIICQLEEQISELYQENQSLSLELKKRKLMNTTIETTEISKI